jgi:HPt (histidine-containing phosphotransfer) domain-containing protein
MESPTACSPMSGVFNLTAALARLGGDERLLRDLAIFYLEDVPPLVERLRDAIERGDAEETLRAAHTIKALSANFDAQAATAAAQVIERSAKAGELSSAAENLPDLVVAVDAVQASLQAEFRDNL